MYKIKSLGILGGTFDPIHNGHLVAAEYARDTCNLDKIIFIPSARPPHKDNQEVLNSEYRYRMVEMAIRDNPSFMVSDLELARTGYSYTVETIDYYIKRFPGVDIYFILGVDALLLINTWKDVNRLVGLCKFIVVTRPGYKLDKSQNCFRDISAVLWDNIRVLAIPGLDISSSDIRRRVSRGETIKYLLPASVEEYIINQRLYSGEESI